MDSHHAPLDARQLAVPLHFRSTFSGRWAYDVLGWGGYWGWDPVENASLMPWLTATAFLHSVMIQEKRGMLKVWNMILIIVTYALVIMGTFLTRPASSHPFTPFRAERNRSFFFGFIAVTFTASMILLFWRWDRLKGETQLDSLLSREAAFLLNNLLFMGVTFATLWGTSSQFFPNSSRIKDHRRPAFLQSRMALARSDRLVDGDRSARRLEKILIQGSG